MFLHSVWKSKYLYLTSWTSACNFLSVISRRLRGYGLAPRTACVFSWHHDYDPLFADLRRRLQLKPGDPVDLEWFLSRG